MLHDRGLLKHRSCVKHLQKCSSIQPNSAVCPREVGKPEMVLKDEQLTAILHVHNVCTITYGQVEVSMGSYRVCIVLRVHFEKVEAAYHRPQTSKPPPRMMLESYILPNICPCFFSFCISMNYSRMHEKWITGTLLPNYRVPRNEAMALSIYTTSSPCIVSEPDPSHREDEGSLGTCLHSSCLHGMQSCTGN